MMAKRQQEPVVFYAPIPTRPDHEQNYVVVLPPYPRPRNHSNNLSCCLGFSVVFFLIATTAYLLYPSDPDLTLLRLHLNNIQVQTSPQPSLDLSLSLSLKVFNRDFFSLDYSSIVVSIGYRGRELGFVASDGGHVRARGSSYVNATLVVDGFQVIHDVFYLIEDLAKGSIPFDTDSKVKGTVGLFFIQLPIEATISCEVLVNTSNQTIVRQDCYSE